MKYAFKSNECNGLCCLVWFGFGPPRKTMPSDCRDIRTMYGTHCGYCEAEHAHNYVHLPVACAAAKTNRFVYHNNARMHRVSVIHTHHDGHDDDNESFNYPNNYTGKAHLVGSEKYAWATHQPTDRPTNKQTNKIHVVARFIHHSTFAIIHVYYIYVLCQQIGLHLVFAFTNMANGIYLDFRRKKNAFPSRPTLTIMCKAIWDVNVVVSAAPAVTMPKLHRLFRN